MERRPLPDSKYDEYVVTEMSRALKPVVIALTNWGHQWAGGPPGPFKHAGCGGPLEQQLVCTHCGESVAPDEVTGQRASGNPQQDAVAAARRGQDLPERRSLAQTTGPACGQERSGRELGDAMR
jgi:hypothetical protein